MTVAVCILSYNRPGFLKDAIQSVVDNLDAIDQVIVCDNGSVLDTRAVVESFRTYNVKWLGAAGSCGGQWNFARSIRSTDCDFVMALHDDDRLLPGAIAQQLRYFESDPSLVAVTSNGHAINHDGERINRTLWSYDENIAFTKFDGPFDIVECYASDSCLPPSPTLYRREALLKCDLQPGYGQVDDAVVFTTLSSLGPIIRINEPIYEVRVHDRQDSADISLKTSGHLTSFFIGTLLGAECNRNLFLKKKLIAQYSAQVILKFLKKIRSNSISSARAVLDEIDENVFVFSSGMIQITKRICNKILRNFKQ